ncbi:Sugar (and other) transporter [Geosmithia morbida]|uniref:Sugar (And other) transporter n=1 Tax=Geosmithia morbida TaxID=1094350 RepID=A0A9P4YW09_9HYPO|nr:Sugar (and other) transporter [Geosmithia morbida]KAF4123885.1 Sugar (and other) transporter [Geosmithia morbida]
MDSEKHDVAHVDQPQATAVRLLDQADHSTTKWQAIKANPKAFCWCLYAVWTVLLVSFENQASGIVISIPRFRKDFGDAFEGDYVVPAKWQSAFSGAPVASQVAGSFLCGTIADSIGRRWTFFSAILVSFAAITVEFISTTNAEFFGGKFLNGFVVGILQAVAGSYVGEIAPFPLRGLLTCLIALSYTLGPFTVALIVDSEGDADNRWAYRSVFCSQYGFAAVAAAFWFFMPESPWWLANKGKDELALKNLEKLGYSSSTGENARRLAQIKTTLDEARHETEGVSYLECFRKSNLRRTIISISVIMMQQLSGINFAASYSTYYAQLAGFSTDMSFKLQITQQVLSMAGNVLSWYLIDKAGRRNLTLYGIVTLTVVLWLMGGLAVAGESASEGSSALLKGCVALILVYCFFYNVSIGAVAYTLLTEVSTSRLRIKTVAIGLASSHSVSVMWSFVLPYMFNPDHANLGGKVGFIFGGLCFPCIAFAWFFIPETRGRTYEELDEMFAKKVPPRHFKDYKSDARAKATALTEPEIVKVKEDA